MFARISYNIYYLRTPPPLPPSKAEYTSLSPEIVTGEGTWGGLCGRWLGGLGLQLVYFNTFMPTDKKLAMLHRTHLKYSSFILWSGR